MGKPGKGKAEPSGQRSIAAFFKPSGGASQQRKRPAPGPTPLPSSPHGAAGGASTLEADGSPAPAAAGADESLGPPLKRPKQPTSSNLQQLQHQGTAPSPPGPAAAPLAAATPSVDSYIIPERDPSRHNRAQTKLARLEVYEPTAGAGAASSRGAAATAADPTAAATSSTFGSKAGSARSGTSSKKGAPTAVKYTPLEEQVLALKAQHPGVLLIVEVGYKMRFFGEDAQVAANVLGCWCYPDHNFLTASIPVPRLPVHVRRLVQAGHKVGVVRQVESAAIKAASDNKYAPFTRQLTALYTPATLDAGEKADKVGEETSQEMFAEVEASLAAANADSARYLLLLAEEGAAQPAAAGADGAPAPTTDAGAGDAGLVGVLAMEIASGDLCYTVCGPVGHGFSSSIDIAGLPHSREEAGGSHRNSSATASSSSLGTGSLETALLMLSPVEVVLVGAVSAATRQLIDAYKAGAAGGAGHHSRPVRVEHLPRCNYLSAADMQCLADFYGCSCNGSSTASSTAQGGQQVAAGGSATAETVLALPPLIQRALAAAVDYLTLFGLTAVLQHGSFRHLAAVEAMQLTSNTLRQLEVLQSQQGSLDGSLLQLMDRTYTASGGALLKRWLAAPLAQRSLLLQRQEAVQELLEVDAGPLLLLAPWLGALPLDLQRTLGRVTARTARPSEAAALLRALSQAPAELGLGPAAPSSMEGNASRSSSSSHQVASPLLRSLLDALAQASVAGTAKQLLGLLDAQAAAANDMVGVFRSQEEFADVHAGLDAVAAAEAHLQALLPKLAATAGVRACSYVTIQNQGTYLVELPADFARVPAGWEKVCSTKKVARFHPPEVKAGMQALAIAQETLQATCASAWTRYLGKVSQHQPLFWQAAAAAAQLDALQSLAAVARSDGYCRPVLLPEDDPPQLHIQGGRHPVLDVRLAGGAVPNDVELAWGGQRGCVVTGPNMGGKSVYTRMAACIALMAQVGSWVPADSVTMSVLDGVYTRMGASDNILQGRSTFMEELGDAAVILQRATPKTLVILDELGRGTATHDGVAIATATLAYLLQTKQCLTLFVTHYPSVAAEAASMGARSSQAAATGAAAYQALAGGPASTPAAAAPQHLDGAAHSTHRQQQQGPQQQEVLVPLVPLQVGVYHMAYLKEEAQAPTAAPPAPAAPQPAGQQLPAAAGEPLPQPLQGAGAAAGARAGIGSAAAQTVSAATGTTPGAPSTQAGAASTAAAAAAAAARGMAGTRVVPTIVFLYKLVPGQADRSFGLNVAQMAGLPAPVVQRAAAVAAQLEERKRLAAGGLLQRRSCDGEPDSQQQLEQQLTRAASPGSTHQNLEEAHEPELQQVGAVMSCLRSLQQQARGASVLGLHAEGLPLQERYAKLVQLWQQMGNGSSSVIAAT